MHQQNLSTSPQAPESFPAPPSLDTLQAHLDSDPDARIYVDFDYTLFGSNSTEVFVNSGQPAFVAALILRVLRGLRVWSWTRRPNGSFLWRDAIRIWAVMVLLPWTFALFKKRAPALFRRYANEPLAGWLSQLDPARVVIVTNGYKPIVRALLRDHPLARATLVGSTLSRPTHVRRQGKLEHLDQLGLRPVPVRDIVLTDSMDDADLLAAVDRGYLSEPVGLDNHNRLAGVYVPFFYSARVKRSPEFVIKQMFLEEVPIILLATVFFQPFSPALWLAAGLLILAFLTAYELGYAENDRIGYLNESRPKLAEDYERFKDIQLEPSAWYWVTGLTLLGAWCLGDAVRTLALDRIGLPTPDGPVLQTLAVSVLWLTVVAIGRLLFHLYNRMAMVWRVFGYILLHFGKYFSLVLIFPAAPAGYALLCAQIVRTWSLYAIRRSGGDMELVASQSIRLGFFVFLLLAFDLATPGGSLFTQWTTWVLLAFCVVRAAPEARRKLFNPDVLTV
ncbi:MAG: hypothetical protein AAFU65_14260, partial [Pseudomonadota bacterium]